MSTPVTFALAAVLAQVVALVAIVCVAFENWRNAQRNWEIAQENYRIARINYVRWFGHDRRDPNAATSEGRRALLSAGAL